MRLADEGLRLANQTYLIEARTAFLMLRARARARLGDGDGALADLQAAAELSPHSNARFERAQLLVALGRREEAVAEAKRVPSYEGNTKVRAFIAAHSRESPPKRVRHAKLGEGTVVAIEGSGDQQTLTIAFPDGQKRCAASSSRSSNSRVRHRPRVAVAGARGAPA